MTAVIADKYSRYQFKRAGIAAPRHFLGRSVANMKIFFDDSSDSTIESIRAKCRKLKLEKNIGLVVIDYLQLVSTGNRRVESRQVEVSEISRSLKTMALELGVPVLALSQLSRCV